MLTVSPPLPALSSDVLSLYYTQDVLLEDLPIFVFYGHSTTGNSTQNSSRIQAHVYSLAGFHSFPRLTVAPTSPLYAAVNHLPAEQQGDEVARGLAVGLLSYFAALPKELKAILRDRAATRRPNGVAPMMFDEMHAGDLAAAMEQMDDSAEMAEYLLSALSRQALSWIDMDVTLPLGTIQRSSSGCVNDQEALFDGDGLPLYHYGQYNSIIESLGSPAFLPTSKLQRAPSRPTAHNKSKTLSKDQKIFLRREICELVDTESSYISKISNLVKSMAVDFRKNTNLDISEALFPQALTHILEVNEGFYLDAQSILDETENEAIKDIEGGSGNETDLGSPVTQGRRRDPTGSTHVAKALLRWFPKFMSPYQEYLRASTNFSSIINQALANGSPGFSTYLQTFGEQRLRSALIEPVQRLPRYSLLIDNMISLLPSTHSALSNLLQARDIITEICALDTSISEDITRSARTLRNLVAEWPASLSPHGRLITAIDVVELHPPHAANGQGTLGLLLLFPDTLVLLQKVSETPLSARGVLAEVFRPASSSTAFLPSSLSLDKGLNFLQSFQLSQLRFSESEDGYLVRISPSGQTARSARPSSKSYDASTKVFSLLGPYLGKASRFSEEVAKARIEARYPESVRDSGRWSLRSISPAEGGLGLLLALSEHQSEATPAITIPSGHVQMFVDGSQSTQSVLAEGGGKDIAICITTCNSGVYRLETEGVDGPCFTDNCTSENIASVLLARLGNLVRLQNQPHNPRLIQAQTAYNQTILEAVPVRKQPNIPRPRSFRPLSPVKMISNLLSSQPSTPSKHRYNLSLMKSLPPMPPPTPTKHAAATDHTVEENKGSSKVTVVESATETSKSPLALLEDTFVAYVVALRSRSGNVVGKVLRGRAAADELAVNELYNTLLEDPSRIQAPAEASVDVLFAAFEKFLKRAWTERMGPLISPHVLKSLQSSVDAGQPVIFAQQLKKSLGDMSPQSRRAFSTTISLLSDLLDASGNDGDRGALIASFAEALVLEGDSHDYIMLLDRLVDDYDNLFEGFSTGLSGGYVTPATGSLKSTRSANNGSMSSNTSSLRRKFGFGNLSRENSKNDSESKVTSIWRSLSKNARSPGDNHSQTPGLSKASLVRSRSTDSDGRMLPPSRPVSRDRPTTSSSSDEPRSRPGSSHLNTSMLSSIGENTPTKLPILPKKKRRSSLSDLKSIRDPLASPAWAPLQLRKATDNQIGVDKAPMAPTTPSPTKPIPSRRIDKQSPQPSGLPRRFGSPQRKEGSPLRENSPPKGSSPSMYYTPSLKAAVKEKSEEVVIRSYSPQKRQTSRSGIPAPRPGLSERTWPPNGNSSPSKKNSEAPQKLRMQTPQKLRQRLSQEQKALATTDESLQAEIAKIGEEMAVYKLQRSPTKPRSPRSTVPASRSTASTLSLDSLTSHLESLSATLKDFTGAQAASIFSISSDVETSLLVSDRKARKLDELYREANAENEALYERFNDELGKILGKVRKGEGVDEMRSKLGEAQEEVGKLRRENAKLKREVVGLRSMMKGKE